MNTYKKSLGIAALILVILIAGGLFFFKKQIPVVEQSQYVPLVKGETLTWQIEPTYKDEALIAEANRLIAEFEPKAAAEKSYEYYVGVAQEYELIGKPREAYSNLLKAIEIDPQKSLAFLNLGNLLRRMNGYESAKISYAKAVEVEPQFAHVHLAAADFYEHYFPEATTTIDTIYKNGLAHTDNGIQILNEYARWLEEEKQYKEAIKILELAVARDSKNASKIYAKIAELKKK